MYAEEVRPARFTGVACARKPLGAGSKEAQTFVLLVPHREGSVLHKINPHSRPPSFVRGLLIMLSQPSHWSLSMFVSISLVVKLPISRYSDASAG